MTITPYTADKTKCHKKGNDGQCCCNCRHQIPIYGHPWVTGTSIGDKTGMYICNALDRCVASHKHGACECWEAMP